jgi:hypothetical protein
MGIQFGIEVIRPVIMTHGGWGGNGPRAPSAPRNSTSQA